MIFKACIVSYDTFAFNYSLNFFMRLVKIEARPLIPFPFSLFKQTLPVTNIRGKLVWDFKFIEIKKTSSNLNIFVLLY